MRPAKESRDAKAARLRFEAEQLVELAKAVDLALEARATWYALKHDDNATPEQAQAYLDRSQELQRLYRSELSGVLLVACRLTGRSFTP